MIDSRNLAHRRKDVPTLAYTSLFYWIRFPTRSRQGKALTVAYCRDGHFVFVTSFAVVASAQWQRAAHTSFIAPHVLCRFSLSSFPLLFSSRKMLPLKGHAQKLAQCDPTFQRRLSPLCNGFSVDRSLLERKYKMLAALLPSVSSPIE